jgi:hypothetical protein
MYASRFHLLHDGRAGELLERNSVVSVRVAEEEKLLRCRVHVELVEGIVHSVQDIYEKCMYVLYVCSIYVYVCMYAHMQR